MAQRISLDLNPITPLNTELMNELNEKVDILMTENALMVEQKAVLAAGENSFCRILNIWCDLSAM